MSYLSLLQGMRGQPSNFDAFVQGVNDAGQTFAKGLAEDREQRRKFAQERAAIIQKQAGAMLQAGQGKQAAELLPSFRNAIKTGYGVDLPGTAVVGAPIYSTPSPVPPWEPPNKPIEIGRDFSGEQTLNALRGALMLEKPKLELTRVGPYDNLVDEKTGKVIVQGQEKPGKLIASYNADGTITYKEAQEGVTVGAKPTSPKLFRSYGSDGSVTLVEGAPGAKLGAKPAAPKDIQRAVQQWQNNRLNYMESYVRTMSKTLPLREDQVTGEMRRESPTPQQIDAWRKLAGEYYDANVTRPDAGIKRPFDQPGSGRAAPAVRGVRTSVIAPPTDYNDTRLQPEWENLAQQASALSPGAVVSSRARSKERNAAAGGVDTSWHRYRQAFDLVVPRREDRAKLIQWGRQKGLEVIDEGDHLHFEPARSSDAMRNFYAKHGLESDDA